MSECIKNVWFWCKKMQNFSGEGAQPPPPEGRGTPPPQTPPPRRLRRLDLNPPPFWNSAYATGLLLLLLLYVYHSNFAVRGYTVEMNTSKWKCHVFSYESHVHTYVLETWKTTLAVNTLPLTMLCCHSSHMQMNGMQLAVRGGASQSFGL